MKTDRGIALINALVLIAAISTLAASLLHLSTRSYARLHTVQRLWQSDLYLDSLEALAIRLLEHDGDNSSIDDLTEIWASNDFQVPIDRGFATGTIRDADRFFNLGWLRDPDDKIAEAAFQQLFRNAGLPLSLADEIISYQTPLGSRLAQRYGARAVPVQPRISEYVIPDQLALVEGMTEEHLRILRGLVSIAPNASTLNVNTAAPEVFRAFVPRLSDRQLDALLRRRETVPFDSVADFTRHAQTVVSPREFSEFPTERLAVTSSWFEVTIQIELDGLVFWRQTMLHRDQDEGQISAVWRLDRNK